MDLKQLIRDRYSNKLARMRSTIPPWPSTAFTRTITPQLPVHVG